MKKIGFLILTIWLSLNLTLGLLFSINLNGLARVNAQETPTYTLTVNTIGSGSVTLDPTGGTYDNDTVVTLTANPESGWEFSGWSEDLSGTTNPESITMNSNKTVNATFTEIPQKNPVLTIIVSGSGTIDPSEGVHSYEKGTDVEVAATADAGWMFDHWILDAVDAGTANPYTVTMDADHNLTAVFIDITPPTIEIISPENIIYSTTNIDLNFTVNEETSWIAYSLDGSDNVTITGNTTMSELSEGSHNIVVFATDNAGNTGASSVVQFTISIPPVDTTPPIIVINSPENTTISVSTVALDFAIDEKVTWIGYSLDGQDNVTITGDTVLSGLTEGSHKITVFATDTADNTGASDTVQFTIYIPSADTTPPTITINSPQNTTYEISEIPLNFSINEDTSWIGLSLDGQNNITISEGIILSGLSEGSHSIVVYANDTAGNTGTSDIVKFSVSITSEDTTPPIITINSPENTAYNTDKITLTFSVNEEPSLKYYSLDGKSNVTVVDSTVLSDLSAGEHHLIMYAEDSAGNIAASEVITFTIVTKSDQGAQLWIVGIIGIVAFTGFMFSAYIAYDLYKSSRS